MAAFIKLKNTPIKEIIFTISFKENVEISQLNVFKATPEVLAAFPTVVPGFNTQVHNPVNDQPTAKVSADGYVFRDGSPHTKLIQARRGSFSLHKVNGYVSFDVLMDEFNTYWKLFEQSCGELTVTQLSVRYLNLISIFETETIDDLLHINVTHPFGSKVKNRFVQHRFTYEANPKITATVVSAIGKANNNDGLILDIILNKLIGNNSKGNFNFDEFLDMRDIKNELFFKSITEKTIKRYNQ